MVGVRWSFAFVAVLMIAAGCAVDPAQSSQPFSSAPITSSTFASPTSTLRTFTTSGPAHSTRKAANSPKRLELPDSSNGVALLIRTDFSNDAVWKAVVAEASRNQRMSGMPVSAENVFYNIGLHPVDDRRFQNMTMQELLAIAPDPKMPTDEELAHPMGNPNTTPLHAYIADAMTMTNPKHPILAVNYFLDRGQHFRLTPNAMAAVEINLSIANLDFNDYIAGAGPDGIYSDF